MSIEILRQLPILSRSELQDHGAEVTAVNLPANHLPTFNSKTSGSTGRPINITSTIVSSCYLRALSLRWYEWNQRKQGQIATRITKIPRQGVEELRGIHWGLEPLKGPMVILGPSQTMEQQLEKLEREQPDHLTTYPSILLELLKHSKKFGFNLPNLKGVTTQGEVADENVRNKCKEILGIELMDSYGAEECGYLAMQCPQHRHYHVQSENVLIEVLDDLGNPSAPGQMGRVVITTLNNYAMPLIRYQINDYATISEECNCGRGLPVIKQILGRSRNMFVLPSGERFYPSLSIALGKLAKAAPDVKQVQIVQLSIKNVVIRMVARGDKISTSQETSVKSIIGAALGNRFNLDIDYLDDIPRSSSGKFEDTICEVT